MKGRGEKGRRCEGRGESLYVEMREDGEGKQEERGDVRMTGE